MANEQTVNSNLGGQFPRSLEAQTWSYTALCVC